MSNGTTSECDDIIANTAAPPPEYPYEIRMFITAVLSCFQIVCISGNVILILAIRSSKRLQNRTNVFVVSLAVSDICVGTVVMSFSNYQQYTDKNWYLGETFCLVATSFDVMFCSVSILHLFCLCIDRFLAICYPFHHVKLTIEIVAIMVFCCWVTPVFISFVPIMNKWNTIGIEDFIACVLPPENVCAFYVNITYAFTCSIIAFYIPVAVMMVCYWKIYICARKQKFEIEKVTKIHQKETKAAKTLCIIMGCFSLCWFPFFIFNVTDPMLGYKIPYVPWTVALWLGYMNSMLNPFLFYYFNPAFRHGFRKIWPCQACRKDLVDEPWLQSLIVESGKQSSSSRSMRLMSYETSTAMT